MVEIKNIDKSFGKLNVLQGLNVTIGKGKAVAILGPNGSGKTTLIKCILGLVIPNKGSITVNGENIHANWNYRNYIGYLPQIARFPENLSVKELFLMIQDLRQQKVNYDYLVNQFNLSPFLTKPLRSLSGGTRQKVNMVMALMFNPEIYIFDEPTVGLDPISCVRFKELVQSQKNLGKTVLITTHILSEVEELADEIIFLLDGKIYYQGSPIELMSKYEETHLERAIAKMLETYELKLITS